MDEVEEYVFAPDDPERVGRVAGRSIVGGLAALLAIPVLAYLLTGADGVLYAPLLMLPALIGIPLAVLILDLGDPRHGRVVVRLTRHRVEITGGTLDDTLLVEDLGPLAIAALLTRLTQNHRGDTEALSHAIRVRREAVKQGARLDRSDEARLAGMRAKEPS